MLDYMLVISSGGGPQNAAQHLIFELDDDGLVTALRLYGTQGMDRELVLRL